MTPQTPYDARAVCNLLLDIAADDSVDVSNLALQKLLYFSHSLYLISSKRPLVSGYFEAWKHGPVHPAAYEAFKAAGANPIDFRAQRKDPLSGESKPLLSIEDPEVSRLLKWVMSSYGRLTPGRLVEISHAKDAPWDAVLWTSRAQVAFGARITDSVIRERFKFHKISIQADHLPGEPIEESPYP